jgi:hypothetical protein
MQRREFIKQAGLGLAAVAGTTARSGHRPVTLSAATPT